MADHVFLRPEFRGVLQEIPTNENNLSIDSSFCVTPDLKNCTS